MAKAETLLKKYNKAETEIKKLKNRLGQDLDPNKKTVNQMTVNETKEHWKKKDAKLAPQKAVPKSIMGRIGRTFSNFGTAISRKSRLLKKSMNRWGNEHELSSKQKQLENTKKK